MFKLNHRVSRSPIPDGHGNGLGANQNVPWLGPGATLHLRAFAYRPPRVFTLVARLTLAGKADDALLGSASNRRS